MAKPIRATPTLSGNEANIFLEKMIKIEDSRITFKQKRVAKEIKENMELLLVC